MNIAILGGSFDPPHRGHLLVAKRLLKLFGFDQVWFMPCYQHPFSKNLSPEDERFEMTKYLEAKNIKVSDYEVKRKKTSYTIDTLKSFARNQPKDYFSWIIGSDQVKTFTKWKNWQEIIEKFKLIIVPRTGFRQAQKELKNITKLVSAKNIMLVDKKKFPPIYISSTLARKKIKQKKSIKNLVPKDIENYIIQNKLYI